MGYGGLTMAPMLPFGYFLAVQDESKAFSAHGWRHARRGASAIRTQPPRPGSCFSFFCCCAVPRILVAGEPATVQMCILETCREKGRMLAICCHMNLRLVIMKRSLILPAVVALLSFFWAVFAKVSLVYLYWGKASCQCVGDAGQHCYCEG